MRMREVRDAKCDHVAGHASTNSRLEPKTARLHGEWLRHRAPDL